MKLWVTCLAFACVATLASAELFSSMAHLETALYAERDIAVAIQDYIHEEEKRLDKLKKIASDFADHSEAALAGDKNLLANPINAYLYMKRFTLDWDKEVAPNFQSDPESAVHKKIEELKGYLPNYDDLRGAVTALLRLQDTYQLDTNQLAQGRIRSMMAKQMSASDCFEIGKMTYNNDDYYHTTLWMEKAMNLVALEKNRTVQRMDILDYLAFSLYKQGNVERALVLTNELLALLPHHTRAQNNRKYYEKLLEEQRRKQYRRGEDGGEEDNTEEPNKYTERPLDEYRKSDEFQTYESLCRGEDTHDYKLKHKLKCRYVHNNNPRLLLKPAKEEEVYLNPWIVIYHDVVSDKEIDTIKRIATPLLSRATVHNPRTGKLETAEYRVSKSAWLKDGDDPVIHNVNNRISDITGLSMATAEELQIANYGLGGQYEPHFDFARREETEAFRDLGSGNRIATWLTYMTNVDAGGATVFTHIGVKLFPIKGAAAFWYNLYRSGDGIFDTRHAACPVLVGQKWVSNKWIHERGQEFRRPCSVNMDE
ncbi:prolyl 4-hydroxylase subunit alpha-1-like isoform X1 [Crassostrea angulata]|uniref:prolyl 4-hydroxylase subunit alpha-1-like isoform X1 n=1 Tax=Magallana angulata TaxID=2784310 RepID=UPI0022B1BF7B|nr:prolyl 4-hydroxylase subunit alpha-1-like isoform X1 [Crassostrea angulata]